MALEDWLGENVETEENRDRVRSAASGLGDLRACELEDLQEALDLARRYNQAVKDAGLDGEKNMNPVDANGQPIPKPGY